jgi:hypothetical protein
MKLVNCLVSAGIVIAFASPLAWGQSVVVAPDAYTSSTTTTTTTTNESAAPYVVNPNDPVQFPAGGVANNTTSPQGAAKAAYVDRKIAQARAQGRDVSAAETQEIMGQSDLRRGMNEQASQHFDAALSSIDAPLRGPQP